MEDNLYNIVFEQAILSSIIFEPSQFDDIEMLLESRDFYLAAHQDIFKAITHLVSADMPIDEAFIKKELEKNNKFNEKVLLDILTANPISNISAYVTIIKNKSLRRHLGLLATEIRRVSIEEELPNEELIDIVEKKLYEITKETQSADFLDACS